jgi:hypothetical protein
MTGFWDLSPIRVFDFYLVLLFVASVSRRLDIYRHVVGMVYRARGRWPKLFELVKEHRTILLTLRTLMPALLVLLLFLVQFAASNFVWPDAARPPHGLTFGRLAEHWWAVGLAVPLGAAMVLLDIWGILAVGQIDRKLLEKYFDQAEYWLSSRTAHVVRFFTLGFVNPRRLVNTEVRKALHQATRQLNSNLWWMSAQMGLRIAFGLSLWLTWVLTLEIGAL